MFVVPLDWISTAHGRRLTGIYAALIALNLAVWAWALLAFRAYPVLLGTALLAYSFGLRHAVDADHIAAIDNVTRKLMQDGQRPVGVGLFFSLGHSSIVVLASVGIAAASVALKTHLEAFRTVGGVVGTLVSAAFLLVIAAMNLITLGSVRRSFLRVKAGADLRAEEMAAMMQEGGLLARLFRPLFGMIRRSWQMYPLGVLFGLGFDTATEIGLLGIAASEAAKGLPIWDILVFPALFTAGMSLVDTADSTLMVGAYGWALSRPLRKLYYNMTITAVSVGVAALVGGIEALGLIGEQFALQGPFWDVIGSLNGNFGLIGVLVIGLFVACWIVSAIIYRLKGYDALERGETAA
ncbi:MAG TPA: HoxN/HupN/NixA family nickel/cobalt transporter [Acetobacteraceae bacterium]|nr:HoxN/HupN/NixA family nickel/cobalt transporter [Acetobacteraceae bacterium]